MITARKSDLAISLVVVLALFMPLIAYLFPNLDVRPVVNENRHKWEKPVFGVTDVSIYPSQYESYFNDRFGFRNILIRMNNRVKLSGFGVSGSPRVLAGRDGWLYYNSGHIIDDHKGVSIIGEDELECWYEALREKKDRLAARGIEYVFVIVPDKDTVYPEHLPDGYGNPGRPTPLDRFMEYASKRNEVTILDLRGTILAQKGQGQLYKSTDTHWTGLGAYIGYLRVMDTVKGKLADVDVLTRKQVDVATKREPGGDLATMLGLQDCFEEDLPYVVTNETSALTLSEDRIVKVTEIPGGGMPNAVMFHDSFGDLMMPLLSESFGTVRYVHGPWVGTTDINSIIAETRPDVVIEELVERNIRDISGLSSVRRLALKDNGGEKG